MTKKEIDELADAISKVPTMFHHGKDKAFVMCVHKTQVVETISYHLSKYGNFDRDEFRRRCYS